MFFRLFLACCSAFILFAAAPGIWQIPFLVWVGLVPLFFAIHKAAPKIAFIAGYGFGLIFNLLLIYWVVVAMHRFGGMPVPASVLVLFLLASYLALFPAIFAFIVARLGRSPWLALTAPAIWVGLDWLRSVLFTGFPWMDLAYDLYLQPRLIQVASVLGHYSITFVIVMVNFLLFDLLASRLGLFAADTRRASRLTESQQARFRRGTACNSLKVRGGAAWLPVAASSPRLIVSVVLLVFLGVNLASYRQIEKLIAAAPVKRIAIVQGNIPQDEKWRPDFQKKTVATYIKMSLEAAEEKPELIIWPETAMPFYPRESGLWRMVVNALLEPTGIPLVSGAPHRDRKGPETRYYNSAFLVNRNGWYGRYDKQHLVPFGEYVPLRKLLFFLSPVVETIGDFTAGTGGRPLSCHGMSLGLLICFETIFPDLAASRVKNGSDLLIDLTNDAWYGRTSAPWQDLAMAAFRAVECRRSLARAANTGFSAFIDPLGRSHKVSPLFEPFVAVHPLPMLKEKSIMVFFGGHLFGLLCFLAGLMITTAAFRRKKPALSAK